jgi:hypothetical protein
MFGFGDRKKIQSIASIASEFSSMCRTVAMAGKDDTELDGEAFVRFLGFCCGVVSMLCENAKLDSRSTEKALMRMFELNTSKVGAKNTFEAMKELLCEPMFVHAVATGKTAVGRWGASGGFPVAGGRLLGELLTANQNAA